jgi:hypothetical protein
MTRKQRIIAWLNIFLLIINISAFIAFLWMNSGGKTERDNRYSSDEFIKGELHLTDQQFAKVSDLNAPVFRAFQALLDRKCELNFKLIDELASPEPSKIVLDSISDKIGRIDAAMKKQTVRHFRNIKSVCNDQQKELLDQLLKDMLEAGSQCKYCNKIDCARRDKLSSK